MQATRSRGPASFSWSQALERRAREAGFILLAAMALYVLLALATYHASDPSWSHSGQVARIRNGGGLAGAWLSDILLYLFGYLAYLFPALVAYGGWLLARRPARPFALHSALARASGLMLTLGSGAALASTHLAAGAWMPLDAGGVLGDFIGHSLQGVAGVLGSGLLLFALLLVGVTLLTSLSWLAFAEAVGYWTLEGVRRGTDYLGRSIEAGRAWRARRARERNVAVERRRVAGRRPPRIEPAVAPAGTSARVERERQLRLFETPAAGREGAGVPTLALLDAAKAPQRPVAADALAAMSRQVESKLRDFGIEVEVVAVHPGPVVTRYELQPSPGLKASRVTALAKDLARSLSAVSVRVVEVIPGKSVIGLELPNEERELVCLSEIIRSGAYDENRSPLTLALGKDISGLPVVVDLARMPHLLVAGTTGSGKSVAINAMVLSLLFKASPEDVRLIMIDPKMLELSVYEGIPHLLAPVVTDMKDAANALRWCVAEMERRYQLMSALGVRNIAGFNRKLREAANKGVPLRDPFHQRRDDADTPPELEPMPFIVVVVDEYADLMMVSGKKVEQLIARLAQKARASGIHLILATQRPSVDVITGLIKANIPSRIAFQVSSRVDSRTILDQMGAEQLLGHGDMLYLSPGMHTPVRVHGAFVGDHEVHKVVSDLKRRGRAQYRDDILNGAGTEGTGGASGELLAGEDDDPLYTDAERIVRETRRASISGVQRRLKVGYNRAARMLEQMETNGVVGPLQSNGAREVLAPPPPQ